jgi:glutathione peroxidase
VLDRLLATSIAAIAAITGFACSQAAPAVDADGKDLAMKWKDASFFSIDARALDGKDADLAQYEGKVALVVNVASQCGLTPQYAALQKLHERFADKGLVVIGVPSGDFGGQEFDTAGEIREFCDARYGVTFPLLEKGGVKPGKEQSPIFECLGTKTGELPGWNFGKYVVSRDGKRALFFASMTKPDDAKVVEAIEKMLAEPAPAKPGVESTSKESTSKESTSKESTSKESASKEGDAKNPSPSSPAAAPSAPATPAAPAAPKA